MTMVLSVTPSRPRCAWAERNPLEPHYHDTEWGIPVRDPRMLWETLMLEGFQAGLSWTVILRKRESLRDASLQMRPEHLRHHIHTILPGGWKHEAGSFCAARRRSNMNPCHVALSRPQPSTVSRPRSTAGT